MKDTGWHNVGGIPMKSGYRQSLQDDADLRAIRIYRYIQKAYVVLIIGLIVFAIILKYCG